MADRRVVQVLGPSTGGIRRHVASLTAGLEARGWDVVVAGPTGVMEGAGRQDAVVPITGGARGAVAARAALHRLVAGADVVHAHGLTAGWLAATLRRRPRLVVTVHNLVLDESAGRSATALRALEARLPARVDAVIAVSAEIARRFTGTPGADRVVVVPPVGPAPVVGRPVEEVRAELGAPDGTPLVVTVARLTPQKDLPTLLRAAGRLRRSLADVRVAIVGQGRLEGSLRREATALGLDGTVVFAGPSPNAPDQLAAADVVAVPSLWESGPLVVAEALQLARPVVSTPVGFVPDLVDDGRAGGRLVPIGDDRAMAAALGDLLGDLDEARRLGETGRARVAELLDPDRLIDAVAARYETERARR